MMSAATMIAGSTVNVCIQMRTLKPETPREAIANRFGHVLTAYGHRQTRAVSFARMDKDQVADILVDIGVLLELQGENPFKTRAYQNAARTIQQLNEPLAKIVSEDRLGEIKGIGEALQQKVTELVTTGKLEYYEKLKGSIPPGMRAMLEIPGLGPKKIKALHDKLGVDTIEKLEQACKEGKV